MQKKLESAGPVKKYNVLGASGVHGGDEDEMGTSGYYNFDHNAGPQLGNKENVISATKKPPPHA